MADDTQTVTTTEPTPATTPDPAPVQDTLTAQPYDPRIRGKVQSVVLPTGNDTAFTAGIVTH